ncbi:hypothetical protein DACRYDRAFT_108128 [Dacryopinax primogenitus]|uniref:Uncharacterized protein n=1 Tax=Dacryopinax primogenitus (strain DJM 731) TaxID=1858805 RepID=M5FUZ4_DACPD|nr:uncharacterized protein DACRYDRAFT_108128 [Dacryopinax primogenitus]EJU01591.1 hypothetical protein DACRYDRAFT_108128 [Dacryopinax primogenitus]
MPPLDPSHAQVPYATCLSQGYATIPGEAAFRHAHASTDSKPPAPGNNQREVFAPEESYSWGDENNPQQDKLPVLPMLWEQCYPLLQDKDQACTVMSFFPLLDLKFKQEDLPEWNGDRDTAILYFQQVQQLLTHGGALAQQIIPYLPSCFSGSLQEWWMAAKPAHTSAAVADWDELKVSS